MLTAGQLLAGEQTELLDHRVVSVVIRCRGTHLQRAGGDGGDVGAVPFGRGGQFAAQLAQVSRQLAGRRGRRRADLGLFLLELPVDGRLIPVCAQIGSAFFGLLHHLLAGGRGRTVIGINQE